MSILSFFPPGRPPRPEQEALLLEIERQWNTHDVFAVVAATAVGKTEVALTVARWSIRFGAGAGACIIEPTNLLVQQFQARYPDTTTMYKQGLYRCDDFKQSCEDTKAACGKVCNHCPYTDALRTAKRAKVRLSNYHVYMAHALAQSTLIVDEGHQLVDLLAEARDVKLWGAVYDFPPNMELVSDVIAWGQEYLRTHDDDKLRDALREIIRIRDGATVEYRQQMYRGRVSTLLVVLHNGQRMVPKTLWPPGKVRKILLLSATIGPYEVAELGLSGRRVAYIECGSPIPAANRPVVYQPCVNMAAKHRPLSVPKFAAKIRELLALHPTKGLIHLPYSAATLLRACLDDPRIMYHDKYNKMEMLAAFRDSPPEQGKVLVASGLYEGIDLPYDAARWGVLGAVPFLNLGDVRVQDRMKKDPTWYAWQAVRTVIQGTGRIVRAPDDKGVFYIFDSNFGRLYAEDCRRKVPLFPRYYRDAVIQLSPTSKLTNGGI